MRHTPLESGVLDMQGVTTHFGFPLVRVFAVV
jgi:hypothetical protein